MAEKSAVEEKLDAIMDAFTKRGAVEEEERKADRAKLDAVCSRMDSIEEERKADKAKKDADEKEEKARKDAADVKAVKDAADAKVIKDEADLQAAADAAAAEAVAEQARKDAAATGDPALRAQLAALEARMPVELPEATRALFVESQSKAERVHQAFGDSAGAPRWQQGESRDQYRRRLLGKFKAHSRWKDVELAAISDKALDMVETQVYADAMAAATSPASIPEGTLRMSVRADETGRNIRTFHGDPEACWAPFKNPRRIVTAWNTKFNS